MVAGPHLHLVEQFEPRDGDSRAQDVDGRGDGRVEVGKGADCCGDGRWQLGEAQGYFGDKGQRAFGADQQGGQVVACRGFACPTPDFDDCAVGEDGLEAQDIVAHGAIANRSAARGAGGGHAAQGGVGSGINGKV